MQYKVVPTLWPYRGRTFQRGELVDESVFGANAASFARLGLIAAVGTVGTKKELQLEAKELGVKVPKGASKQAIVELIEGVNWSEQPVTSTGVGDALSYVRVAGSTVTS